LLLSTVALGEDNAAAVRNVFSAYRSAILSGEGDEAAAFLSQSTYDYYDEMRRLALYGDAKAVQAQSLVNQMQVLLFRLRVPSDQLESLSSQALIAHAVDQGWIGKNSVLKLQPGQVLSEGDVAVLHVIVDGKDAGPAFRFNRESGAWRLDLLPTMQASNAALQLTAKQQGVPENEFMLVLMESVLGRKVGPEAWNPLRNSSQP
jgi:hypothetical protein